MQQTLSLLDMSIFTKDWPLYTSRSARDDVCGVGREDSLGVIVEILVLCTSSNLKCFWIWRIIFISCNWDNLN